MTVLSCFRAEGGSIFPWWIAGFTLCFFMFLGLFVFSILRARRSRPEPRFFDTIETTIMKFSIVIVLGIKTVANIAAIFVGHFLEREYASVSYIGVILLEFPSYAICTCYSCALIAWITFMKALVPIRFMNMFGWTRKIIIVYNALFYGLFVIGMILLGTKLSSTAVTYYWGTLAVARDFALCLICVGFMIVLGLGIGRDAFARRSLQIPRFMKMITFLATCLLLRGAICCIQATLFAGKFEECRPFFFTITMCDLVFIEGLPLAWLMFFSFSYLSTDEDETEARVDPTTLMTGLPSEVGA